MIQSIPLPAIELLNLEPSEHSPLISKCQIKVCYVSDEPNRNVSIIDKETGMKMAPSLRGAAIVGYYNEEIQDFEGHERVLEVSEGEIRFKDATRPYGFIDLNAKIWFQKFVEFGIEREYLMTEGWLWTGQYPECQRVIDKGNNQSMELDEKMINAHWTKDENGNNKFFIINEAIISKLCILGEKTEPCFEGSEITKPKIEFSFENSFKEQLFSMMNEIKDILNKGGTSMPTVDENKVLDPETPVVEKPVVEEPEITDVQDDNTQFENKDDEKVCEKCGKPESECTCKDEDEEDKKQYNLEEIVEYVELSNKYAELKAEVETLKAEKADLETANANLTAFQKTVERKEKKAMIDSFYMLNDEDKKDCIENIDKYSLSEIESKLSVICVRNKVDFGDNKEQEDGGSTVYNLGAAEHNSNSNKPAWVKALDNLIANNL